MDILDRYARENGFVIILDLLFAKYSALVCVDKYRCDTGNHQTIRAAHPRAERRQQASGHHSAESSSARFYNSEASGSHDSQTAVVRGLSSQTIQKTGGLPEMAVLFFRTTGTADCQLF